MDYRDIIRKHYKKQAEEYGDTSSATMQDEIVREKEVDAIFKFLHSIPVSSKRIRLLEIGCGNGFLLSCISKEFNDRFELYGIDMTPELIEIAKQSNPDCQFTLGDILKTPYEGGFFDVLISERVIINVLDEEDQVSTYREMARVLRSGALAVLIEGYKSGLYNLNKAREEFLLEPIPEPSVNNWYTEERWELFLKTGFEELPEEKIKDLIPENFLSSHYFMTRFLHDVIRPENSKIRNTEFARFFAEALPPTGDYSPLRIKYLRRT
ncbi:MAG: class I SAM-dependent methyltransferase [Gammaproteobacteria bacterium]|nr:class I SAM-dependent methyltransferase [Gammaproteobacteria bacterium]